MGSFPNRRARSPSRREASRSRRGSWASCPLEAKGTSMSTARRHGRCRILRRDRPQAAPRPARRWQPDASAVAVSATWPSNPLGIPSIVLHCSLLPARRLEEERASSRPRQEKEEKEVVVEEEASSRRHREKAVEASSRPRREKVVETSSRPRQEKVVEASSRPRREEVVEASSRPRQEKVVEASSQPRPSWSWRARQSWIRVYQESRAAAPRNHLPLPP